MNEPVASHRIDAVLFAASLCLVTVVAATLLSVVAVVFIQLRKDDLARRVSIALETRIAGQRPPLGAGLGFPPRAGGLSFWANHRPAAAPVLDRLWNSAYPSVGGVVATQRELDQVREIVWAVCGEHGYDPEVVAFFVEMEAKK